MCLANVIVKVFYPLHQGFSPHNRMSIHPLFSIYFHLYLEMSRARGFIIFFLKIKKVQNLCVTNIYNF
nr:MAG TPA: hypothetical protein [Caudoviricetes sp.]